MSAGLKAFLEHRACAQFMAYYAKKVKISSLSGPARVIFRCYSLSLIDGQSHIIENGPSEPNLVALFH